MGRTQTNEENVKVKDGIIVRGCWIKLLIEGPDRYNLHEIFIRLTKDIERVGLCSTPKTKENLTKFDTYHWDILK
jgi:hypothetical protein